MVDEFYLLSVYVWMNEKAFAAFCIAVKVVCEIRVQQKSSELIFFCARPSTLLRNRINDIGITTFKCFNNALALPCFSITSFNLECVLNSMNSDWRGIGKENSNWTYVGEAIVELN